MIEVLWVDDQPDVARTFARSIRSTELSFSIRGSIDDGLREVRTGSVDLILTDLAMPPGTWGGLEFLQRLAAEGWKVPVVVVSGEGSQAETIQALRLGAKDYVTKEALPMELESRLLQIMAEATSVALEQVQHEAPRPIASAMARFHAASQDLERLDRLFEAFEETVRLVAIVGIAELYSERRLASLTTLSADSLRSPSFGKWDEWRIGAAGLLTASSMFWACNRALEGSEVREVIRTRNKVHHGGRPEDAQAGQLLTQHVRGLHHLAFRLQTVGFPKLVAADGMVFDGGQFVVSVLERAGFGQGGDFLDQI